MTPAQIRGTVVTVLAFLIMFGVLTVLAVVLVAGGVTSPWLAVPVGILTGMSIYLGLHDLTAHWVEHGHSYRTAQRARMQFPRSGRDEGGQR